MPRYRRLCLLVLALCLTPLAARAQDLPPEAVSQDVVSVMVIDIPKIDAASLRSSLQTILGEPSDELKQHLELEEYQQKHEALVQAGAQRAIMVFQQSATGQPEPVGLLEVKEGADVGQLTELLEQSSDKEMHVKDLGNGWLQVTETPDAAGLPNAAGPSAETFRNALKQAGDAPITAVTVLNDQMRQQIDQQIGQAPPEAQPILQAFRDMKWMTASTRLGETPSVTMAMEAASADAATQLQQQLTQAVQKLPEVVAQFQPMLPPEPGQAAMDIANVIQGLQFKTEGSRVTAQLTTQQLQEMGKVVKPFMERRAAEHEELEGVGAEM